MGQIANNFKINNSECRGFSAENAIPKPQNLFHMWHIQLVDVSRVHLGEAVVHAGEAVDFDAALDGVPEDAPPRAGVAANPEPTRALLVELFKERQDSDDLV